MTAENGVITIDEFVDFMNTPKRCQYDSEELLEQFRLFDKVLGFTVSMWEL